jgi:hypothetical protein
MNQMLKGPLGRVARTHWAATLVALAVTLGVHRDHRHRTRIPIGHHVGGRGRVFLEMVSVAMGSERGLVVVRPDSPTTATAPAWSLWHDGLAQSEII